MARVTCCFCSENHQRAKEHVWPVWLQEHFGTLRAEFKGTHETFASQPVSSRTQTGNRMLLGSVCCKCNNGWMSSLEAAAKPAILSLCSSRFPDFSSVTQNDRHAVACWAFKTAIVINRASNYRDIVPPRHFRFLYDTKEIPDNVWVDAGVLKANAGLTWLQSQFVFCIADPNDQERVGESQAGSYNICLGIGSLVLRVFHTPLSDYRLDPGIIDGDLMRLHPESQDEPRIL